MCRSLSKQNSAARIQAKQRNHKMFEQTFLERDGAARRPWPVAFSFAAQAAVTGAILMIPLINTAELAFRPAPPILYAPPRPVQPPPVMHQTSAAPSATTQMLRQVFRPVFTAPSHIPATISMTPDPFPAVDLPMSTAVGLNAAFSFGPPSIGAENRPAAVQPHPVPATPKQPIRVSNGVQAAKLLSQPKPLYPALARSARISGTVHLQAIIGRDGTIRNLQLVGGPPLLSGAAALDAVRRWVYQPTLLNGEPVEVFTEIEVNFTLNQ